MQPSPQHHPVIRYVPPEEFEEYIYAGRDMGFMEVAAAPLVRSSSKAAELFYNAKSSFKTQTGRDSTIQVLGKYGLKFF